MYSDVRPKNRPENRPSHVRKTGQNCLNTVPEASPEKPEIGYEPPRVLMDLYTQKLIVVFFVVVCFHYQNQKP